MGYQKRISREGAVCVLIDGSQANLIGINSSFIGSKVINQTQYMKPENLRALPNFGKYQ